MLVPCSPDKEIIQSFSTELSQECWYSLNATIWRGWGTRRGKWLCFLNLAVFLTIRNRGWPCFSMFWVAELTWFGSDFQLQLLQNNACSSQNLLSFHRKHSKSARVDKWLACQIPLSSQDFTEYSQILSRKLDHWVSQKKITPVLRKKNHLSFKGWNHSEQQKSDTGLKKQPNFHKILNNFHKSSVITNKAC